MPLPILFIIMGAIVIVSIFAAGETAEPRFFFGILLVIPLIFWLSLALDMDARTTESFYTSARVNNVDVVTMEKEIVNLNKELGRVVEPGTKVTYVQPQSVYLGIDFMQTPYWKLYESNR